jgi:hypothetical protein
VHQTISSDVVGGEATLLPTEEWVEHEVMKSASGWIEVHKQSIVSIVLAFFRFNCGQERSLFLLACYRLQPIGGAMFILTDGVHLTSFDSLPLP